MRSRTDFRTIVCGAGIAGAAAAYYLSARYGHDGVLIVERDQPLSLTTSKSGENYRDYWPDPTMTAFSRTSIDLMSELAVNHGDAFRMRETGYLFASRVAGRNIFPLAETHATERCSEPAEISERWPHLSVDTNEVVTVPRAGSIDVQALGQLMLGQAARHNVEMRQGEVVGITQDPAGGFNVSVGDTQVTTEQVVLATGPFVGAMAAGLGVDLPLFNVAQRKFVMPDPAGVVPSDMPFTICADPVTFEFSEAERDALAADVAMEWLLSELPAGLHVKPEPGGLIKLGWAFNRTRESNPERGVELDTTFPNIVVRAAARMIPGLAEYVGALPTPVIQYGGYYNRTEENWPLIGPTNQPGLFVVAGLAGFGTMTACAAGDLLARHIVGEPLPSYAPNFHPHRYDDRDVVAQIEKLASDGQL